MDYTTVANVRSAIHSDSTLDETLLAGCVTAASRNWDRICTGVPDAVDYFKLEDVTNEILVGQVDYLGEKIICFPHKPIINSVAGFTYQESIIKTAYTIDPTRIETMGGKVTAYPDNFPNAFPAKCRISISYNGGLAVSGSGMPADMIDAVTVLAVRMYREMETGLADQIGVAELSTMIYTRALPIRVQNLAEFYKRRAGWRYVA